MAKIIIKTVQYFEFYCLGCKRLHTISDLGGWTLTGHLEGIFTSYEKATIRPSILNQTPILNELTGVYEMKDRCHLFVTNGNIEYCPDCDHELAGQTVKLPNININTLIITK